MSHPKIASLLVKLALLASACSLGAFACGQIEGCGPSRPAMGDSTGIIPNGGVFTGPCSNEGAVAECHVETGRLGDIVNCFAGTQTCVNGMWSECGGSAESGGTISSLSLSDLQSNSLTPSRSAAAGQLGTRALYATPQDANAVGCASNPCNPYCLGVDVDADNLAPMGTITVNIYGTVTTPADFPGGVTGPKAQASKGVGANPPYFECTPGSPPSDYLDCNYDYCCMSGPKLLDGGFSTALANTCQPYAVVAAENPVTTQGCERLRETDYQVGLGCAENNGTIHVPICNRGETNANTGILKVEFYSGNPNSAGTIDVCKPPGSPQQTCSINLAAYPIAKTKCTDLNLNLGVAYQGVAGAPYTCTGVPSGNATMMINPSYDRSISGATWASGVATVTTSSAHGFSANGDVIISGVIPSEYNGAYTIASVDSTGTSFTYARPLLTSGSGGVASLGNPVNISSATWSSGVATIITSANHGRSQGETVTVSSVTPNAYNGTYTVASVPNATTLTYALPSTIAAGSGFSPTTTIATRSTSVSAATWSGDVATITSTNHRLVQGDQVTITGAQAAFNGTFTVTSPVATDGGSAGNTFTYALPRPTTNGSGTSMTATAAATLTISSISISGSTVTVTTSVNHGLKNNDTVTISGVSPAGYNGTYSITRTGNTTFTYSWTPALGAGAVTASRSVAITGALWTTTSGSGTAVITAPSHRFLTGDSVSVAGIVPSDYNVTRTITVPSGSTSVFNYALAASTVGPGTAFGNIAAGVRIASASWASGVATIKTSSAHGFANGATVTVFGVSPTDYNVTRTITVVDSTTFTYALAKTAIGNGTSFGTATGTPRPEGDICNNYSFIESQNGSCVLYGQQPPPSANAFYLYTASCPPGYKVEWNQFAYAVTAPSASEVFFQASTSPFLPDGGTPSADGGGDFLPSPPVQVAKTTSSSPSPDPAVCTISGSPDAATCPKNLGALLGADRFKPVLKLGLGLISITEAPSAQGWNVTFNCVPDE